GCSVQMCLECFRLCAQVVCLRFNTLLLYNGSDSVHRFSSAEKTMSNKVKGFFLLSALGMYTGKNLEKLTHKTSIG
ncbi:hypothetical protein L9F63_020347, partial [Diploptera punctata]